jgi:hypothetical protein
VVALGESVATVAIGGKEIETARLALEAAHRFHHGTLLIRAFPALTRLMDAVQDLSLDSAFLTLLRRAWQGLSTVVDVLVRR